MYIEFVILSKITMNGEDSLSTEDVLKAILDSDITPRLSVRTPNGSVTVYTLGEISATERKQLDDYAKKAYPNATLISNSTAKYNCHSYEQ